VRLVGRSVPLSLGSPSAGVQRAHLGRSLDQWAAAAGLTLGGAQKAKT